MQGDIRRKKDLLPRYKTGSKYNSRRKGGFLTTPMKKIVLYMLLLCGVYYVIQLAYSDLNKETEIVLEGHTSDTPTTGNEHNNGAMVGASDPNSNKQQQQQQQQQQVKVPKEKFNNEVAKQQEVKNLENDLKPQVDSEKQKQINKDKKEQKQQLQKEKQDIAKEKLANSNEILDN